MADSDPTRHDPTWQETADEARQHRIEALRNIAAETPQTPAEAAADRRIEAARQRPSLAPLRRRSRPRATWLAAGTLVLAIVVIAVFILTRPGGASTGQQAATATTTGRSGPLVIRPAVDALGCPTAAAWSGDGAQLAVLGATTCDEQFGHGMLNVYNFPAGKLIARFQLDSAVAQAINSSDIQTLSISYTHVLWLGPAIYATFLVNNPSATTDDAKVPFVGLLRANPSDTTAFAFVRPNGEGPNVYTRWNPVTGQATMTRDAIVGSNGNVFATLPPSLAYGWQAGGTPDPLNPLAAGRHPPTDPGGPIGDPSNNARLTIWQPGFVVHDTGRDASSGVYIFSTDFAAVSGGQPFLFDAVHLQGVLVPSGHPAPDRKSLAALDLASAPWLPVRDAALQAVIDAQPTLVVVAWRPDGAVLAVHAGIPFDQNATPTTSDITFYDTSTGHVLGTLRPPGGASHTVNPLLWAPDGRALLLVDKEAGSIVIWTQSQLPH
ncbi:MAG TPA: hypothetical protein VFU88_15890 [Ktedonobacterales bacterium]|nr:hypothetical protein [Ktedonobacterales bacterium]